VSIRGRSVSARFEQCIRFLNGRSVQVEQKLDGMTPLDIKLCSIVKAELLYGAARSNVKAK
jgi:tRNA(fMet)-specific endonuclease VapC